MLHNGISEPPVPGETVNPATYQAAYEERMKKHGQPFWPDSAWRRDVVFSVLVIGVISGLAALIGPPKLGPPPDPAIIDAYPQPDWYLLWYYAAFALMPPKIEDYVILGGPVLIGVVLFAVPFLSKGGERSPRRRPWAVASVAFLVMMGGALWLEGARGRWSPNFAAEPLTAAVVGTTTGPVAAGARDFHDRGCLYCHLIDSHGGRRGPDLSRIGSKLTSEELTIRIINGGTNMPAFAGNMPPQELSDLVAFLASRRSRVLRRSRRTRGSDCLLRSESRRRRRRRALPAWPAHAARARAGSQGSAPAPHLTEPCEVDLSLVTFAGMGTRVADGVAMDPARPRVVIVGGGFGGLTAARAFKHAPVDVTLIDRENYHLFQPMLYQAATAELSETDVATSLREILSRQRHTHVLLGEVASVDLDRRCVTTDLGEIPYDFLVLAAGAEPIDGGNAGGASWAPSPKSLDATLEIRRRVLTALELADSVEDAAERRLLLEFIVVGGGPTGVEFAGALADGRAALTNAFRQIAPGHMRVHLVHGQSRVLPTFAEALSRKAAAQLERRGRSFTWAAA